MSDAVLSSCWALSGAIWIAQVVAWPHERAEELAKWAVGIFCLGAALVVALT